ncbi:cytochrome c biogenesis protein ResB [Lysinimonas soli]|uniref:Cytochrome c biogenesis protein ResB n=1 Tax=Lysinimonas soli TaxID=1074233 RepID=A0ABW0NTG6_9MICO
MASRTRSETGAEAADDGTSAVSDPLRPSDHIDSAAPAPETGITQPRLNPMGYLRFFWRQLTSMRTALILLLLLALAAVPGSLVPQRSSDPNGVVAYQTNNPDTFKILDSLGLFSTFTSPWFSAIYLLLFVSLVGCIIPRLKHHIDALRAAPPKTPARLERLVGYTTTTTSTDAETAIAAARSLLARQGYRVARYDGSTAASSGTAPRLTVSGERGYLRETGNLIFHMALVGMLLTVGVFGSFGYTGQRILVKGEAFTNALTDYDSFNPGRFADENSLSPFQLRLDTFTPSYVFQDGTWEPKDFTAALSTRVPGSGWSKQTLKVNSPLEIGGTQVYLLGNGYAPVVTIKDPKGTVVFSGAVPFLSQDPNLTSSGVIKVPDGLAKQVAFQGFFCPTPVETTTGCSSIAPYESKSQLQLSVFTGDLGLDKGVAVNAYSLNEDKLTKIAGFRTATEGLKLTVGSSAELPDGLGSIEFTGVERYVSVDIHHDPTPIYALTFALLILGGLLLSLFVPRRRVWIAAIPVDGGSTRLEYAGLARGEDPTLAHAVAELVARHAQHLDPPPEGRPGDGPPPART